MKKKKDYKKYLDMICHAPTREEENKRKAERYFRKVENRIDFIIDLKNFLKKIFYTPLSMFLRVISWVAKIVGAISVLGMFVGLYNGWKFIKGYSDFVAIQDFSLLKSCIGYCILPFIVYAVSFGTDAFADYLESEI